MTSVCVIVLFVLRERIYLLYMSCKRNIINISKRIMKKVFINHSCNPFMLFSESNFSCKYNYVKCTIGIPYVLYHQLVIRCFSNQLLNIYCIIALFLMTMIHAVGIFNFHSSILSNITIIIAKNLFKITISVMYQTSLLLNRFYI